MGCFCSMGAWTWLSCSFLSVAELGLYWQARCVPDIPGLVSFFQSFLYKALGTSLAACQDLVHVKSQIHTLLTTADYMEAPERQVRPLSLSPFYQVIPECSLWGSALSWPGTDAILLPSLLIAISLSARSPCVSGLIGTLHHFGWKEWTRGLYQTPGSILTCISLGWQGVVSILAVCAASHLDLTLKALQEFGAAMSQVKISGFVSRLKVKEPGGSLKLPLPLKQGQQPHGSVCSGQLALSPSVCVPRDACR